MILTTDSPGSEDEVGMQAVQSQLKEVGWPHGKLCKEVRDQGTDVADVHNTGASLSLAPLGLSKTHMQQLSGLSLSMCWAFGIWNEMKTHEVSPEQQLTLVQRPL